MNKFAQKDLDDVYDTIDLLMKNNKWIVLNQLFICWELMAWRHDADFLLGCATASLPGKSKIPSRERFIKTCKSRHANVDLWKGLE